MTAANEYVTAEVQQISERMMQMMKSGKIRNHKLGNTAVIHHGEWEEKELGLYKSFLLSKNFNNVMLLRGNGNYGEY